METPQLPLPQFTQTTWYQATQSPAFKALLLHNLPPPEAFATQLRGHFPSAKAQVRLLADEVRCLRSLLATTMAHLRLAEEAVIGYQAALAPIRRVPYGLVYEIFDTIRQVPNSLFFDRGFDDRNVGNAVSLSNGPWVLSHVCSLWRDVALDNPSFWQDISLIYNGDDGPPCYSYTGLHKIIDVGVKRSQERPLRVGLFSNEYDKSDDSVAILEERETPAAFGHLFRYASRFIELVMEPTIASDIRLVVPSFQEVQNLGMLQRLCLKVEDAAEGDIDALLHFFANCTALADVKLEGFTELLNDPSSALAPILGWHQLNAFNLNTSLPLGFVLDILRNCSRLQRFSCNIVEQDVAVPLMTPVLHEALTELHVDSSELVHYITAPQLQELNIHGYHYDSSVLECLCSFVSRSGCIITSFCLYLGSMTDSPLPLLRLLSSVTDLSVTVSSPDTEFIQLASILSSSAEIIAPSVKTLRIFLEYISSAFISQQFAGSVMSILRSKPNLKSFNTFVEYRIISDSELRQLNELMLPYGSELKERLDKGLECNMLNGMESWPLLCFHHAECFFF
jgi:hypothetical protein